MKKYIYSFIVACMALFAITSCSDVDIPEGVKAPKAENLTSQVDGRTVTLNWTLPTDENKSGVDIYRNNALLESLGLVNSAVLELQPGKSTLLYTVKMKYDDGRVSDQQVLPSMPILLRLPSCFLQMKLLLLMMMRAKPWIGSRKPMVTGELYSHLLISRQ